MPSTYAHYRFGFRMIPKLDQQTQTLIQRNRQFFDLGTHGPDFFFYYNPFLPNRFTDMGKQSHQLSGKDFFTRAVRNLRLSPDERAQSYLWGMMTHFVLDSLCHPYINEKAKHAVAGHMEMETEFDRFLLELDRKPLPHEQDIFRHIQLEKQDDAAQVSRFYPRTTPAQIKTCFRNMKFFGRLATAPEGIRREFIGAGLAGNVANESMMMLSPNPRCKELTPEIYLRYTKAEKDFPELARQFSDHLHRAEPLGNEFERIFG